MVKREGKDIRVLICDDSLLMRNILKDILSEGGFDVIGTAKNGREAVELTVLLEPDVITMDINMPDMDGITAIKEIMKRMPTPVVVISGATDSDRYNVIKAMEAGAVDFIPKPGGEITLRLRDIADIIVEKVRTAAMSNRTALKSRDVKHRHSKTPVPEGIDALPTVVVIGASTGGPNILPIIFSGLRDDIVFSFILAQHMPSGFTASLASRLNQISPIIVEEARNLSPIFQRVGYVCPGGRDTRIKLMKIPPSMRSNPYIDLLLKLKPNTKTWYFTEVKKPEMKIHGFRGLKPSIDAVMLSVARTFGERSIGIILSGMGEDGRTGMKAIKDAGGITIAQKPETAVVPSMPESAIEAGVVDYILSPGEIAKKINSLS